MTRTPNHDPAELSVLDVGCGGGSLSLLFDRAGCRVTGVDPGPWAIEAARLRLADSDTSAQFDVGFSESLPYPAGSFDVVVCSEVAEHVARLETALDELYRVLEFGGVLLLSTPNRTILSHMLLVKMTQDR